MDRRGHELQKDMLEKILCGGSDDYYSIDSEGQLYPHKPFRYDSSQLGKWDLFEILLNFFFFFWSPQNIKFISC